MIQNTADKRKWLNILGALLLSAAVIEQLLVSTMSYRTVLMGYVFICGVAAQLMFTAFSFATVKRNRVAATILVGFMLWLVVSRPLVWDFQLVDSMPLIIPTALNISILCYAASLEDKERKRLFALIAALICIFCFYVCLGLLYAAVTRRDISIPPFIGIKMKEEGGLHYVNLVSSHRNYFSQWYCLCFCLAACLAALSEKKFVKAACGIMMAAFYVIVAIELSRISMIALALSIGMMSALLVIKRVPNKKTSVHVAIALAAVLVVTPVVYKSYNLVGTAVGKISLAVTPIEQKADAATTDDDAEKQNGGEQSGTVIIEEGDAMFTETRTKENVKKLGGRVVVWKSMYNVLKSEPSRLLFGDVTSDYMSDINRAISQTDPSAVVRHTHNYLIETLFLTGIPGLLLMIAFSVILVVRMVKVFFSPDAGLFPKLLTIPLAANLLKGMGEATLIFHDSVDNDITNYIFFLAAGIFLAYSYELFPEKGPSGNNNKV